MVGPLLVALVSLARESPDAMDPGWPNVLIAMFVVILAAGATASIVVYRRARASIRDGRRQRQ